MVKLCVRMVPRCRMEPWQGVVNVKATTVIRQRLVVRPSLPQGAPDLLRRGPRADRAELELLRQAARRMVLFRRSGR